MTWRLFAFALLLACRDDGDGEGAGSGGAPGGSGGLPATSPWGDCYYGRGSAPTSTVTASGFESWNGTGAHGCFRAQQSFPSGCADATVVDGGFSLTASTCTGNHWEIQVAERTCVVWGNAFTPADCHCGDAFRPADCPCGDSDGAGATSGFACDAGVP